MWFVIVLMLTPQVIILTFALLGNGNEIYGYCSMRVPSVISKSRMIRAFKGTNFAHDVVVSLLQGAIVPAVLIVLYIKDM